MRNVYGVRLSGCTKLENGTWRDDVIFCIVYANDAEDAYLLCERETNASVEQIILLPVKYNLLHGKYSHIITEI